MIETKPKNVIYVPEGVGIPAEYTPAGEVFDIPGIDSSTVAYVRTERIDVSTAYDSFKSFIAGPTTITTQDGQSFTAGPDVLAIAFRGGGRYRQAWLNPIHGPITLAEHEKLEAESLEDEFQDW